jgi:hypothetical protein
VSTRVVLVFGALGVSVAVTLVFGALGVDVLVVFGLAIVLVPFFSSLNALLNCLRPDLLCQVNLIVLALFTGMINNNFTIFVLLNSVLFSSSFNNFTHSNPIGPPPPPIKPPVIAELPEPTGLYSGIPPPPTYNFLGLGVGFGFGVSFSFGVGVGFANAEGGIGSGIPSALIDH